MIPQGALHLWRSLTVFETARVSSAASNKDCRLPGIFVFLAFLWAWLILEEEEGFIASLVFLFTLEWPLFLNHCGWYCSLENLFPDFYTCHSAYFLCRSSAAGRPPIRRWFLSVGCVLALSSVGKVRRFQLQLLRVLSCEVQVYIFVTREMYGIVADVLVILVRCWCCLS
jgi:hypothetical protein